MEFSLEQRFSHAPDQVQHALLDPGYLARLADLPKLGRPQLLDQRRDGGVVHQRVRYAFVGELSPAVRKVVDPARLTWVERSVVDLATRQTTFTIEPDHYQHLLAASGTAVVEPGAGGGARRSARGTVRVRVPLVGAKVERAIVSGLEEHADAEQAALEEWLAGR